MKNAETIAKEIWTILNDVYNVEGDFTEREILYFTRLAAEKISDAIVEARASALPSREEFYAAYENDNHPGRLYDWLSSNMKTAEVIDEAIINLSNNIYSGVCQGDWRKRDVESELREFFAAMQSKGRDGT
jgi:hypothetical protein